MEGGPEVVKNLNTSLLWGTRAAVAAAAPNDPQAALAQRDPKVNPHIAYIDTDARGYGLVKVTGAQVAAKLVTVPAPIADLGTAGSPVKGTVTFTVAASAREAPKL